MNMIAIFHNVRSTHNVGSLFRTAECAGVEKIYLTGYTPAPIDRFGREQQAIAKVALGAQKSVPWESGNIVKVVENLKQSNHVIVGVEQTPESVPYKDYTAPEKAIFIFGNEVDGLPEDVLALCDTVVEIPVRGEKESLNVAVTAGIILFHFN
ncbi:MAG: TrmH family RNA methyltransferase [Candidatus Pacebacteria bacterium]|nr:TrmH family RNA methyltransferase [Candidatus Paceibacterota bacterium]